MAVGSSLRRAAVVASSVAARASCCTPAQASVLCPPAAARRSFQSLVAQRPRALPFAAPRLLARAPASDSLPRAVSHVGASAVTERIEAEEDVDEEEEEEEIDWAALSPEEMAAKVKSVKDKKEKKEKKAKSEKKEKKEKKTTSSSKLKAAAKDVEAAAIATAEIDTPSINIVAASEDIEVHQNGNGTPAKRAKTDHEENDGMSDVSDNDEGDFSNFRISESTIRNLRDNGYKSLFKIQAETFKPIREGKDVLGKARTGTGKTLSFALPVIELLREDPRSERGRAPRTLVIAPTRELARQVSTVFEKVGPALSTTCIYGGDSYERQSNAIRRGLDVLVGTPGRLLDHLERGSIKLTDLKHLILDEADRMLEQGFVEDIEKVLDIVSKQAGSKPQMIMFSATMPSFIRQTLDKYMKGYVMVDTVGKSQNRTAVGVRHLAICCPWQSRKSVLSDVVQVYSGAHGRTMIFTQTKRDANDLALDDVMKLNVQVLHGDIAQGQREKSLQSFREGKVRCLVATDVAARGLDIPEVDLVVQCEPPRDVESYIHRSGRTGRAGRDGVCICFYKPNEESTLRNVERRAGIKFERIGAPQPAELAASSAKDAVRFLDGVPDEVLPYFVAAAKEIIEEKGDAVNALAAALAHISGTTNMTSRSLLSSLDNYTTVHIETTHEIRAKGFVWGIINRQLGEAVGQEIKGLRLQLDKQGAVFDIPTKLKKQLFNEWTDSPTLTMKVAETLPELEPDMRAMGGGGGFGGRGAGGGGFRGGRRAGGYGGNSGGGNRSGGGSRYGGNSGGGRGGRGGGGGRRNY